MENYFDELMEYYFPEAYLSDSTEVNRGKIHHTYKLNVIHQPMGNLKSYILQVFNTSVFPDYEEICSNHQLVTNELEKHRQSSPAIVPNLKGTLFTIINKKVFRILKYLPGRHIDNSEKDLTMAAFALGEFHKALGEVGPDIVNKEPFHNLREQSRLFSENEYLLSNLAGFKAYKKIFNDLGFLNNLFTKKDVKYICHNDPKTENFLIQGNNAVLLDLDTVAPGFCELDLADMLRSATKYSTIDELICILKYVSGGYLKSGKTNINYEKLFHAILWVSFELFLRYLNDSVAVERYFIISAEECLKNADMILSSIERLISNEERIKSALVTFFP